MKQGIGFTARHIRPWVVAATLLVPLVVQATDGSKSSRISDNLYGVVLADANTAWAVGGFGTVVRTRDGGKSWQIQNSGTLENLFDVSFVDTSNGWIVGRSGLILHSSDGGDTWKAQNSGSTQHLFSVKALSRQKAVAIGDWGTILSTADGGATWQAHPIDRDVILNSQAWADAEHGWVVGEAGTLFITRDGGSTWQEQLIDGVDKTLFGVTFKDAQTGWIVGLDGIILRTRDGGTTWETQHGDTTVGALDQVGAKAGIENPSLYGIAVADQIGYAVGEGGAVFQSTDSGGTWQRKAVPAEANLRWIRSVSMVPGTHGVLVGASGLILNAAGPQLSLPIL